MAAQKELYFAFGNGRWTYDCHACQAYCCKGHGYTVHPGIDAEAHVRIAPLRVFMDRTAKRRDLLKIGNLAPGCFFLSEDNRCLIQDRDGYASKPLLCRLFPFNIVRGIGRATLVAPHPSLCPLRVSTRRSECSSYDALRPLVEEQQAIGIPSGHPIVSSAARLLELEREILDKAENDVDSGDVDRFAESQHRLTKESGIVSGADYPAPPSQQWREILTHLVGIPWPLIQDEAAINRTLVAAWPAVRADLVFPTCSTARPWIALERLPHAMVAVHLLMCCAAGAGMKAFTFQTVWRLLTDQRALIWVLAHADAVMAWRRNSPIDLSFWGDRAEYAAYIGLVQDLQRARYEPLGRILLRQSAGVTGDRTLWLKTVVSRIAGRIRPRDEVEAHVEKGDIRRRIQRLVVCLGSPTMLTDAGERLFA